MVFYVIEIQTADGAGSVVPFTFTDRDQAESKYHSLLAVAAVSDVQKHGAMLFNADGFMIKSQVYDHTPEPEPEPVNNDMNV